jgi:phosphonate transport system permease protein
MNEPGRRHLSAFGLLAARNTSPHRFVHLGMRTLLNVLRAIPDLILGLLFVAAAGLGRSP